LVSPVSYKTSFSTSDLGLSKGYSYGFNGKEKDDEGLGGGGSTYDYGFRIYNPALGRFLSVDPLFESYPFFTPYQFSANTPISSIDLDGLEAVIVINSPWFVSKIKEAYDAGDIVEAIRLSAVATTVQAKNKKQKEIFNSDVAGTFNHNESEGEGLTVLDASGNVIFSQKEPSSSISKSNKGASSTEEDDFDWGIIGDIGNGIKRFFTGAAGGGQANVSKKGGGEETREAKGDVKFVEIDMILAAMGATKAAAGKTALFNPKQFFTGNPIIAALKVISTINSANSMGLKVQGAYENEGRTTTRKDTVVSLTLPGKSYIYEYNYDDDSQKIDTVNTSEVEAK
jgi:RHS repeat-associated protein